MAQAAIAYRKAGKSDRFLEKVEDHFKDTLVSKITAEVIRQASIKVYPDAGPATRNRQFLVPAAAIINHAAAMGWGNPIRVKRFQERPEVKTPATEQWVLDFAVQAEADGLPHLAALTLFMFATGARIGEATALTWADVDLSTGKCTIRMGKVERDRRSHLPLPVVAAMANIGGSRNPDELVFGYKDRGSVRQTWFRVIERAGIERLTPHCCRHGFATEMFRARNTVADVARLGGWKDLRTLLQTYAHATADLTATDVLFGKKLTQYAEAPGATSWEEKEKSA